MDNLNLDFFVNENIEINLNNFIINLLCTLILCVILRYIYIKFSTTLSNKDEFSKNFVILGITTCIVITIVKSSLALSLGLVGALSIVRFRAAIKEPEELVYLFLVIAIGLGNGAGQTKITVIGSIIAFIIITLFSSRKINNVIKGNDIVQVSIVSNQNFSKNDLDNLMNEIKKNSLKIELISINQAANYLSLNLNLEVDSFDKLSKVNQNLISKYPDINIVVGKDHNISL